MGSSVHGVDVVGVSQDKFGIIVSVLHGNFHFLSISYDLKIYYVLMDWILVAVLEGHHLLDSAFVMEDFGFFAAYAVVLERDLDALVQEGHLS